MYKYELVTVNMKNRFAKSELIEHKEIIQRYASQGWRFITAIPSKIVGYGAIASLDLVFEKEEKE